MYCHGWSTGLVGLRACDVGGPRSPPAWPARSSRSASAKVARRLAAKRAGAGAVPVRHIGLDGQAIGLPDASCDAALSTFTLCTVADPAKVLAELRRVLRSEGRFHFLDHGIAPEPSAAKWQRRLDPWQRRLADGCHLTRDTLALVGQAGFVVERYEQGYARGPKPWSYFTMGIAVNNP